MRNTEYRKGKGETMLNQLVLVGRITTEPKIKEGEPITITLAVPRSFKNEDGEYETDFIPVTLWRPMAENVCEYCKKGDLVGIKGRVQSDEDGNVQYIAEKVTFLSSRKPDGDKEEE